MTRHGHLSIKIDISIVVLGQTNTKDFFVLKNRNLKSFTLLSIQVLAKKRPQKTLTQCNLFASSMTASGLIASKIMGYDSKIMGYDSNSS